MRIGVAQNIRWPASGAECKHNEATEMGPERRQQPGQKRRFGKVRNDAERIRRLVPGENKVGQVHEQRSPEDCFGYVAPSAAPPRAPRGFIDRLIRKTTPTQAQCESDKDKEQQSGREFRKKSASQSESELEDR